MSPPVHPTSSAAKTLLRWSLPVMLLALACGVYRATRAASSVDSLSTLPTKPHLVAPRYDVPQVATNEQLAAVLRRMEPPASPVNTNVLVHALRLWGPKTEFSDPQVPDGPTMLEYFLDDATFRRLAGEGTPPLFRQTEQGVTVRAWREDSTHRHTGAVHVDDLLATLAESGVSLDTPLKLRDGEATVGDLLRGAMRRFHQEQDEYEWTAISYARYLFPAGRWENQYGQPIDIDLLITELLEQPLANGVCGGTHRLEALAVLARIDDQLKTLSRRSRRRIVQHLGAVSALLIETQHLDGYWSPSWTTGSAPTSNSDGTLYERILLTGHHLEWLALAPPEVQPPREVLARAGQWLVRAMLEADAEDLREHYGPFTHAARALCLWRGKEPAQVWKEMAASAAKQTPATSSPAAGPTAASFPGANPTATRPQTD